VCLHTELHNLYSSSVTVRMIKSVLTRAENVGWVGELKSGCSVLFRNSEGDLGEDGRKNI